uniref:Uncharacterized protein n=1 Tax=Zea mays TaxID=4577 RepID=C4IZG7_MAIZE|nr:unknown [Zea mays]
MAAGDRAAAGSGGATPPPPAGELSDSLRWKLRWQPQAAQRSASMEPSSPAAMNSPQPSTACPPMPTAWFLRHSRYLVAPPPPAPAPAPAPPPPKPPAGGVLKLPAPAESPCFGVSPPPPPSPSPGCIGAS